jgi:hypothetical protein
MCRAKRVKGPLARLACALRCLFPERSLECTRLQALLDADFYSGLWVLTRVMGSGRKAERKLSGFHLSLSTSGIKEVS